jgi:hypothetical protein
MRREIPSKKYECVLDLKKKWFKKARNETVFDRARISFVKTGFNPKRMNAKVITGVSSQSVAILQEARQGVYENIVMGKREDLKVEEFSKGCICGKVIELAKKQGHLSCEPE